jgi:hypothetical protein
MNHPTQQQLTDAYYDGVHPELRQHLTDCDDCRSNFESLRDLLDLVSNYPVPERGASYGHEVWARLLPHLPARKQQFRWLRWRTIAPALAALLAVAFFAGMLIQQRRQLGISLQARERVLLITMSDHLERSQIVLAELLNSLPGSLHWTDERDRARDLIPENRLLRQTALRAGEAWNAALLDELERVLLDVANSPSNITPGELDNLRREIESKGLLFKVRITSFDARQKGQKL